MSDAQRVIDDITALVDEQMVQEASGWDHDVNQPRCRCCRSWHGLPRCRGDDDAIALAEAVGLHLDSWQRHVLRAYFAERQPELDGNCGGFRDDQP